jgi:hypothetical protein
MKIFKYLAIGALVALSLASCDKDTEGLTDITYYPDLKLVGDEFMIVPVGTAFVDPGCTGLLYDKNTGNSIDVTDKIIVSGADEVDPNTMGFYYVTYSAAGSDGYMASVTRTICVCDPEVTLDMGGTYETDMSASLYGAAQNPFSAYAANYGYTSQCTGIKFTKLAPGFYSVNDLLGGWYDQVRGFRAQYGSALGCMTGYVSLDNEGNIDLISSHIDAWGDALDYIDDASFDEGSGVSSYFASYAEGAVTMRIVLNRVSD